MKKTILGIAALALLLGACGGDTSNQFANEAYGAVTIDGTLLPPFDSASTDGALGQPSPSVSGVNSAGEAVAFTPGSAPTLLVFVAHWCPHCQAEVPRIVEWLEGNPDRLGVDVVAIATGSQRGQPNFPPAAWLDREGWDQLLIMDDEDSTAARAFGLTSYPFWVAVDSSGAVVGRVAGELGADQIGRLFENLSQT
ncbi:MAG: TlpA family protein disulfide reductase [Acidimicrobiia bacterium]|nr:TlpA family protein disulfide reductase [Acidimicrobiia bacterium]MDH4308365.1 TlpA family protein disulfide reductase [Acidimicrobiia bacterium]